MDVLAGRKTTGTITGDVHVAGYVKDEATFARVCGCVTRGTGQLLFRICCV